MKRSRTENKNHEVVIKSLTKIDNVNVKLLICGWGELEIYQKELITNLGLDERIVLAGYRNDIIELLHSADCFVFPSLQEGLPVTMMEAMAAGLPIICSNIRGNVYLVEHGINGFFVGSKNVNGFKSFNEMIVSDKTIQQGMRKKTVR